MMGRILFFALAVFGPGCGADDPSTDAAASDGGQDTANDVVVDAQPLAEDERRLETGVIRGQREGGAYVFRGIPFAAPPVGQLRFRPPQPPAAWEGTREATAFGPPCAQWPDMSSQEVLGEEDCLHLNVWEPAAEASPRPVMVWIHGGDNRLGSTGQAGWFEGEIYDGQNLATQGDVVFVSVQYRLGALGFLSHPDFADDNPLGATGNWGLMDLRAALEWVQSNIAAFGGDPNNVTIFGQSAGGDNSCALVASPQTAGLFHRAVFMSPGGCHSNDAAVSARVTDAVLASIDCDIAPDPVDCLRSAPMEWLARGPQSGAPLHPERVDFYVEVDGWFLPEPPRDIYARGAQNAVPLMIGTTAEEYSRLLPVPAGVTEAESRAWMASLFGDALADRVVAAYPASDYGGSTRLAIIAAQGDAVHHCSVRRLARAAESVQPVYRYVLGHRYSDSRLTGAAAAHGFDIPLVFGNATGIQWSPEEVMLSDKMLSSFVRFAHIGDPNASGQDDWPAYSSAADEVAVVAIPWASSTGFRATQCDFWDSVQ
ncbi:MAG: carboxylesterase family protein [Myxococcota bacterium]